MKIISRILCHFFRPHRWKVTKWDGNQRNVCILCGHEEFWHGPIRAS